MQAELSAEHLVASGRVDQPAATQLVLALLVVLDNDLMPPVLAAQLDSDGPPRVEGDPIGGIVRPQVPVEGEPVDQKRRERRNMRRFVEDIGAIRRIIEIW